MCSSPLKVPNDEIFLSYICLKPKHIFGNRKCQPAGEVKTLIGSTLLFQSSADG